MSSLPVGGGRWTISSRESPSTALTRDRMLAVLLRTVFLASLVIVILHVSMPQSSSVWTIYESPLDLVRVALGLLACLWIAIQLFVIPDDAHAHRTWLYLGLAAVPFALICIVGIW
jgi:hypothetical protein